MPTEPAAAGIRRSPLAACALAAAALLFYIVAIRLRFQVLPLSFLALGFLTYAWNGRRAMLLFLFLLPLVNSTPDLFFNGYPFNYMGIPLFHLAGMLAASRLKGERPDTRFPGQGAYRLFLTLLALSALFVFFRWSNLGLPSLALLRDTPVAPSGDRVSFACIFPAITLALFFLSPWASFLLRHWRLGARQAFLPIKAGFTLSFLLALAQKWIDPDLLAQRWWLEVKQQLNGGFSDFNAFGFFAGAVFLWQALDLFTRLRTGSSVPDGEDGRGGHRTAPGFCVLADVLFLALALAAVMLSGTRTAFLFVIAAAAVFLLSKKSSSWLKGGIVLGLALLLLFGGGRLGERLRGSVRQAVQAQDRADLFQAADSIGSTRLSMLRDGGLMVCRFPLAGVGCGNFLFYLKYLHHGEKVGFDLPLNQYLLFFSETGVIGGLAFLAFLAALLRRTRPWPTRGLLAVMGAALFFNNFFWFPEVLLLFWVIVSLGEGDAARIQDKGRWLGAAAILVFVAANLFRFAALHPRVLTREKGTPYDYGFYYLEREDGRAFRWTGKAAGIHVQLDPQGRSAMYTLYCGAPLSRLPRGRQRVDVYWRGKLYRSFVFFKNGSRRLRVRDRRHGEGFLEFRSRPAFNLERMALGEEARTLGVQVSGPGT